LRPDLEQLEERTVHAAPGASREAARQAARSYRAGDDDRCETIWQWQWKGESDEVKTKRIYANGDYLLIAPKEPDGNGYHHMLVERAYLADNILSFLKNHPEVDVRQITIYELRELNEKTRK
jgi:hypothetical protein